MLAQRTAWQWLVQLVITLAFILSMITPVSASHQENATSNSDRTESTTQSVVRTEVTGSTQQLQSPASHSFGLPWTIDQTGGDIQPLATSLSDTPTVNPSDIVSAQPWTLTATVTPLQAAPNDPLLIELQASAGDAIGARMTAEITTALTILKILGDGASYDTERHLLTWDLSRLQLGQQAFLRLEATLTSEAPELVHQTFSLMTTGDDSLPVIASMRVQRLFPTVSSRITPQEGGSLRSADGRITITFPKGAVDVPVIVEQRTLTVTQLALHQNGVALQCEVTAYTDDANQSPIHRFNAPVEVRIETAGLVDLASLGFTEYVFVGYWDIEKQQWSGLLAKHEGSVLVTTIDHFTIIGMGTGTTYSAGWVLTGNNAQVSTFDGAFTYAYPVQVPAGRGGLTPDIKLTYNNRRIDGILSWVQSDWAGFGWSIDAMEIVRKITPDWSISGGHPAWYWNAGYLSYENIFTLLYKGTAYKLAVKPGNAAPYGRYYTEDDQFLYIERRNALAGNGSPDNETSEYWIVRMRDGTQYRLGYLTTSEQVVESFGSVSTNTSEANYAGDTDHKVTFRWRVDQITDTLGNEIKLVYTDTKGVWCCWDSQSYLADIYYNKLANGTTWGSHIAFVRSARNSDGINDTKGGRDWFFYQDDFLHAIRIENWNGSAYQTVREYRLGYTAGTSRPDGMTRLLTSITEYAPNGTTFLPATAFTYWPAANKRQATNGSDWDKEGFEYDRIQTINNGYGGTVVVGFNSPDGGSNSCANCGEAYNYRVAELATTDATFDVGSRVYYTYPSSLTLRCYDDNDDSICDYYSNRVSGSLIGYSWVEEKLSSMSATPLTIITHTNELTQTVRDRALGRERKVQYADSQGVVQRVAETLWVTDTLAHTSDSSTSYFVYTSRISETLRANGSLPATPQKVTEYQYTTALQGGTQYGNLTQQIEYSNGQAYRSTVTTFYPATGPWIVSCPATQTVHSGAFSTQVAKTRHLYDGHSSESDSPIRGLLTRTDQSVSASADAWYTSEEIQYDASIYYQPTRLVQRGANTVTVAYDSQWALYPITQTNALGQSTIYTHNTITGVVTSETGPNGSGTTISYGYDPFGRLKYIVRPGDSSTTPSIEYEYVDTATPLKIVTYQRWDAGSSGRLGTARFYNGLGQLIQVERWNLNANKQTVTSYSYNAQGLKTNEWLPYEATTNIGLYITPTSALSSTAYSYDALGRVLTVTHPDGTWVRTSYDGLKQSTLDENGHQRIGETDPLGRLAAMREYTGTYSSANWSATPYATTIYTYSVMDLLTSLQDANGLTSTIAYDALGRKTVMTDTDMGTWYYEYDIHGNLSAQTDAKQQRTCLYYDTTSRLTAKVFKNDGWGGCPILGERDTSTPQIITPTASMTYTWFLPQVYGPNVSPADVYYSYDSATGGNLGVGYRTGMSSTVGGITLTLTAKVDNRGRTISETRVISGVAYNTRWSYNDRDQVATQTYPSGEVVTTTYDLYGRPNGLVVGATTYITQATYDPADRLLNLPWSVTGAHTTYSYYPWSTMGGRLQRIQSGSSSGVHDYQNLAYQYDAVGNVTRITDTLNSGQVQSFSYDALDRLISASTSAAGQGQYSRSWTYGKTGNILSDGHTFSYDDPAHPHAVSSVVSGASYVYDFNGNATTITPTTGAARLLDYDYENRLISTAGAVTMQLSYDGDGQRVLKQDGSTVTRYIGAWSEISVTAGTTATTNYYWFAGRRVAMKVGSAVTYLFADQLGSTVKTTGNQTTVERYEPYGVKRGTDAVSTPYRFTGQREEDTLGLYDYGARWYDPSIGRFVQADTIVPEPGNPQSLNRYSYGLNNPMRYTDPTGHAAITEGDGYNHITTLFDWEWLGRFAWDRDALDRALRELFRQQPNYVIEAEQGIDSSQKAIASICKFQASAEYKPQSITASGVFATIALVIPAADYDIDLGKPGSGPGTIPNPYGQIGNPDHQNMVNQLINDLNEQFPQTNYQVLGSKSLKRYGVESARRPDAVVIDLSTDMVVHVGEVGRTYINGTLVSREAKKLAEYTELGIPYTLYRLR